MIYILCVDFIFRYIGLFFNADLLFLFLQYSPIQVVWMADYWSVLPDQNIIFGYDVHLEGGKVMELETLPTFKAYWDSKGGLAEFQKHILKILKLG